MSRIYSQYLADIAESCERVRSYVAGMTLEEFASDQKTIDAVARNLEIIGEAVKCIPDEVLAEKPTIPWRQIRRFRDKIAHHYFAINLERVWSIVTQTDLEVLEASVQDLLAERLKIEDLD